MNVIYNRTALISYISAQVIAHLDIAHSNSFIFSYLNLYCKLRSQASGSMHRKTGRIELTNEIKCCLLSSFVMMLLFVLTMSVCLLKESLSMTDIGLIELRRNAIADQRSAEQFSSCVEQAG